MQTLRLYVTRICLCACLALSTHALAAQIDTVTNDTSSTTRKKPVKYAHSPRKAALFSAVLPGLGQAYNKKWWKIPIVYAAIGTSTGFIVYNQRKFRTFKDAYIFQYNNPGVVTEYSGYSTPQLFEIQDTYHDWRDLSIIVTAGFYILNILDATVDAHFFRYDVGDDLTLQVSPNLNFVNPGISICLHF